jgi:prephenate dehydrogenase
MSKLSVAIIGLDRTGTSVGRALRRYMSKGGKHQFEIIGHDLNVDAEKQATKMGAVDKIERRLGDAVAGRDIVILNWSFDEMRSVYRTLGSNLRNGTVILDMSPLKRPTLELAQEFLTDEHHLVGITPLVNPRYLFSVDEKTENAEEDLFDNSAIVVSPASNCAKEAVDLAYNFCLILGSKPRFLDPQEHDAFLTFTEGLPALMGTALFYALMKNPGWADMQWFTNPGFAALTRVLRDVHPDALRDEWLANRDTLTRAIDETMTTLQILRNALAANDRDTIEAAVGNASAEYERWINHRFNADWDKDVKSSEFDASSSLMTSLFGGALSNRLFGKKDDKS